MKDLEKQIEDAAKKQEFVLNGNLVTAWVSGAKSLAAKDYWQQGMYDRNQLNEAIEAGINKGLRKQQQGMYSEEEVKVLIQKFNKEQCASTWYDDDEQWFEQNKKK